MSKISFDSHGNPAPYSFVNLSVEECETLFVHNFPTSKTRVPNWSGYIEFTTQLKKIALHPLTQWIDGSFTTNKLNPGDIDLVSIINPIDFHPNIKEFDMNRSDGYPKKAYNIDGYIIIDLPASHQYYDRIKAQKEYWAEFLSSDREGNKKAIVEVKV